MKFTIALCTYNRCDVLPLAVRAAAAQAFPRAEFEILIVDNRSTDGTPGVVEALEKECGPLRCVREENQGLSHARNRAIAEARAPWIVFVDDDATLAPGYLAALEKLLAEEQEVGAAGGPIEVGWLAPVPAWYEASLDKQFNQLYLASWRKEIRYPHILYGTNMCFPVGVLQEVGGFDPSLGRKGDGLAACEDGEILLRIARRTGRRILWDPALRVVHYIHPGRLTPEYLLRKGREGGRSQAFLEGMYPGSGGLVGPLSVVLIEGLRVLLRRGGEPLTARVRLAFYAAYLRGRLWPVR